MNNIEVHGLFATPIITTWYDITPEELSVLREEADSSFIGAADTHGIRSTDINILERKELASMRQYMCDLATILLKDIMAYDVTGSRNIQSWVSVKRPGEQHIKHNHPNCMVTAVYFYDDNHPDADPLYLHKQQSVSNTMRLTQTMNAEHQSKSEFAWGFFTIPAEKGRLVFFPSYMEHSVPINKTNVNRYSFAMNFIPDPFDWNV